VKFCGYLFIYKYFSQIYLVKWIGLKLDWDSSFLKLSKFKVNHKSRVCTNAVGKLVVYRSVRAQHITGRSFKSSGTLHTADKLLLSHRLERTRGSHIPRYSGNNVFRYRTGVGMACSINNIWVDGLAVVQDSCPMRCALYTTPTARKSSERDASRRHVYTRAYTII